LQLSNFSASTDRERGNRNSNEGKRKRSITNGKEMEGSIGDGERGDKGREVIIVVILPNVL